MGPPLFYPPAAAIWASCSGVGWRLPLHAGYLVQLRKYRPPNRDFCNRMGDPQSVHGSAMSIFGSPAAAYFGSSGGRMSFSFSFSSALMAFVPRHFG